MNIAGQGVKFGAFTPVVPGGDAQEAMNLLETRLNRRLDIVNSFRKWGATSGDFTHPNTQASLRQVSGAGRIPLITWEPLGPDGKAGAYSLESIANGTHDEYIRRSAVALRDLGREVYVRPMHEMNGQWYPWSGDPETYVKAWRHIVDAFTAAGAGNVRWVWCVNVSDQPKGNRLEDYWPLAGFVDVLGIDAYNCYGGWRAWGDIVRPAYDRLTALSGLPIWVCETATGEADVSIKGITPADTKARWIDSIFAAEGFDQVEAVLWFDENNPNAYSWSLATSTSSVMAMRYNLGKAAGWVAPPGPYVPPTPDRVTAVPAGPGAVTVSWRTLPSFNRGCRVVLHDRPLLPVDVPKGQTSVRIEGLAPGPAQFSVYSWTLVRQSPLSARAGCDVAG